MWMTSQNSLLFEKFEIYDCIICSDGMSHVYLDRSEPDENSRADVKNLNCDLVYDDFFFFEEF